MQALLAACPFLMTHLSADAGPYQAFGKTAGLLVARALPPDEEDAVFAFLNRFAETAQGSALDLLATGALEMLNDTPQIQSVARQKLKGRALEILETMRVSWGQPDYT